MRMRSINFLTANAAGKDSAHAQNHYNSSARAKTWARTLHDNHLLTEFLGSTSTFFLPQFQDTLN